MIDRFLRVVLLATVVASCGDDLECPAGSSPVEGACAPLYDCGDACTKLGTLCGLIDDSQVDACIRECAGTSESDLKCVRERGCAEVQQGLCEAPRSWNLNYIDSFCRRAGGQTVCADGDAAACVGTCTQWTGFECCVAHALLCNERPESECDSVDEAWTGAACCSLAL